MVSQHNLSPVSGAKKDRKRVGRGNGSGHGTYSGRGSKGQKSRAGGNKMRPGFEGGQLPLIKRLPRKRGFTNIFRTEYSVVNVGELNVFDADTEVTPEKLKGARLIKSLRQPVKILADGELEKSLVVKVDKFTAQAKAKIEAAGGKVEEVKRAAQTG
ncbi:50S ribosomal protein L15 [Chloroflexota bacterium]